MWGDRAAEQYEKDQPSQLVTDDDDEPELTVDEAVEALWDAREEENDA